jgi:hypothetical protein
MNVPELKGQLGMFDKAVKARCTTCGREWMTHDAAWDCAACGAQNSEPLSSWGIDTGTDTGETAETPAKKADLRAWRTARKDALTALADLEPPARFQLHVDTDDGTRTFQSPGIENTANTDQTPDVAGLEAAMKAAPPARRPSVHAPPLPPLLPPKRMGMPRRLK